MTFQSAETDKLSAALVQAQSAMGNAKEDADNPYFKSRYATLASIREASLPHLNAAGLALTQTMRVSDSGEALLIRSILLHTSGQWLLAEYPVRFSAKPQEMGSAISYARRYAWQAICGMATQDDDGQMATAGAIAEAAMAARKPQAPPPSPMKAAAAGSSAVAPPGRDLPGSRPGNSGNQGFGGAVGSARTREQTEALLKRAAETSEAEVRRVYQEVLTDEEASHFKATINRVLIPMAREAEAIRAAGDRLEPEEVFEGEEQ